MLSSSPSKIDPVTVTYSTGSPASTSDWAKEVESGRGGIKQMCYTVFFFPFRNYGRPSSHWQIWTPRAIYACSAVNNMKTYWQSPLQLFPLIKLKKDPSLNDVWMAFTCKRNIFKNNTSMEFLERWVIKVFLPLPQNYHKLFQKNYFVYPSVPVGTSGISSVAQVTLKL